MSTNGNINQPEQYQSTTPVADNASTASSSNLGKDEVAWFFVEQYYTTLSKTPEKLHLFYGKKSQFVSGNEGAQAPISVGRQAIQERIKELDFQDCKVRVSNVDSQASFENIVIQVIGETSNKASDPKKFVQTFVLAQQPSGYFVLNDVLRYIDEESDETAEVPAAQAEEQDEAVEPPAAIATEVTEDTETSKTQSVEEAPAPLLDAGVIDQKLEEVSATDDAPTGEVSAPEVATEEIPAVAEPEAQPEEQSVPDPEETAKEIAEEDMKEAEKPADPSPTPVTQTRPPAPAPAQAPVQPPKPMTWANRAAAAAGPVRPVVPLPKTATPPAAPRSTVPTQPPPTQVTAPPTQTQPTETSTPTAPAKESSTEWQNVGGDARRQNRPQSISGPPAEHNSPMGYVKYVTDKVKEDDLRATLERFGPLVYFDINRQKNCAFVEFESMQGYRAAASANPHTVNGENVLVEPRRPKPAAYGGSNYTAAGRGGPVNRGGRGGFDGNRSGSQGNRGGFGSQRGRGGGGAPRARGPSQATNA